MYLCAFVSLVSSVQEDRKASDPLAPHKAHYRASHCSVKKIVVASCCNEFSLPVVVDLQEL